MFYFGKPGTADGELNLPHGVWIDDRPARDKTVVVADRANNDRCEDTLLVPDRSARVTLLDADNMIHLGEDEAWRETVMSNDRSLRREPKGKGWRTGRFLHSHDACFDKDGNIIVAEWVDTGRITRLKKLS